MQSIDNCPQVELEWIPTISTIICIDIQQFKHDDDDDEQQYRTV